MVKQVHYLVGLLERFANKDLSHSVLLKSRDEFGDIAKAVVCGADAVMLGAPLAAATEAPADGAVWSMASFHPRLPRGRVRRMAPAGSLEQILLGPSDRADGATNLMGGLRKAMAVTGHGTLKDLQKADLMITAPPSIRPGAQW